MKMFTLGSCVWVINGFFVFLPEVGAMSYNNTNAEAWSAFAGGTIFEIGGVLMIFESLNRRNAVRPCLVKLRKGLFWRCRGRHLDEVYPSFPSSMYRFKR